MIYDGRDCEDRNRDNEATDAKSENERALLKDWRRQAENGDHPQDDDLLAE